MCGLIFSSVVIFIPGGSVIITLILGEIDFTRTVLKLANNLLLEQSSQLVERVSYFKGK